MTSRKITDYTELTTPDANSVLPIVDTAEAVASNRNKKIKITNLTGQLRAASTSVTGIVQLNNATNSTSTTQAATANAVKLAYDAATTAASTSVAGIVQLNDTTASTSTTQAATANAVKTTYDLANGRSRLTLGTAQNSTSGTSIDFTGIPSWAARITVSFAGISTNGTSPIIIQLGTASSIETTSYLGTSGYIQNTSTSQTSNLSSGVILVKDNAAANIAHGSVVFTLVSASSNTWAAYGVLANSNNAVPSMVAGSKALAGTLTRLRITTVGGTDTFDAGVVNIMYEG